MGTFNKVAANNFGRLRRAWPEAVFLSHRTAKELSVLFSQEAGMEEYLDELIEASNEAEHAVEENVDARTVTLTSPFRAPSYAPAHRRAQDAARISSRGLLPNAWCSGVIRAPRHFDFSRWFPRYPLWWLNRGVWMKMPYALSYLAHKLVYEFSAAWYVVIAEYYYFLAAGWVHTLLTYKVFSWLDATALPRMSKLDWHLMASGPGGQAMLDTFHKLHKATEVFPWTIVVKDVIQRDTQTRAARQVHVHLDSSAEYGFTLNCPCRSLASLPACGGGSDEHFILVRWAVARSASHRRCSFLAACFALPRMTQLYACALAACRIKPVAFSCAACADCPSSSPVFPYVLIFCPSLTGRARPRGYQRWLSCRGQPVPPR